MRLTRLSRLFRHRPGADQQLHEIRHVRQQPGEKRRRWFASASMDLITWHDADGHIAAFQLCYDKPHRERALTWREERSGIAHQAVDDGESSPLSHKATPILLPDGPWDAAGVRARFLAQAGALPADITGFVAEKLAAQIPG